VGVTVGELIERLGGELVLGDPETVVGVADVERAKGWILSLERMQASAEKAVGERGLCGCGSSWVCCQRRSRRDAGRDCGDCCCAAAAVVCQGGEAAGAEPLPVKGFMLAVIAADARCWRGFSIGAGAVVGTWGSDWANSAGLRLGR
jgi:hypothetical protein